MLNANLKVTTMAPLYALPTNNSRKRRRYESLDKLDNDDALVSSVAMKRVRFEVDRTSSTGSTASLFGDIVAEKVHESDIHRDDLDKEALWWSKNEHVEMSDRSRKLARGFKRQETELVSHYLDVFEACSKTPTHSISDFLSSVTLGVPAEVRGLECGFIPTVKAHRKKHSQHVLDTQAHLMKGRMPEAMCHQILSSRAIRSSRPSRVMARLIGEADTAH
jgi:hypothetical protein